MLNKNYLSKFLLILIIFCLATLIFMFAVPHMSNSSTLLTLRFNKWLSLFLVGGLTGIGSYIVQLLTGNKKADISIIGIGASNILMIVVAIFLISGETFLLWQNSWFIALVFLTSLTAVFIVWIFSRYILKNINSILIIGIIFTIFVSALGYLIAEKSKISDRQEITRYLVGSILINEQNWNIQSLIGIGSLLVVASWLFFFGDKLVIAISDEKKAKSLGVKGELHKFVAIICVAIAAASSFIIAGNIMFIGLAIGHINYQIFKKNTRWSSVSIILIGGIVTISAYYLFDRLLNFKTYEGIYIVIFSGMLLTLSVAIERILLWKNK